MEDDKWISMMVNSFSIKELYPNLAKECIQIIISWQKRFDPGNFSRICRKNKVFKELNEIAPVIKRAREWVTNCPKEAGPITILDLCSGKGFLGMFLAELIPPDRLARIILIDKMWPMNGQAPTETQICPDHIWNEKWPVPILLSKHDVKKGRELKWIRNSCSKAKGPCLFLAVHLCGTLSIKAVGLFNDTPKAQLLVLKPCCLPGKIHLRQDKGRRVWKLGQHSFSPKDIYGPKDKPITKWTKRFGAWGENLFAGIDVPDTSKSLTKIKLEAHTYFPKNIFIMANR